MSLDKFHDSAGVPWEGREFQANSWAADDGSAPLELERCLSQVPLDKAQLVAVISRSRLLIPLLATLGDTEIGPSGLLVDKSAELAIVAVATPDGKTAIPAFSCVEQLSLWNSKSRPVPASGSKVALAAASEGHERVIIDPAGARIALRSNWFSAIAQQLDWAPPHQDPRVFELVSLAAKTEPTILAIELLDGDPAARLEGPELIIQLELERGLEVVRLRHILAAFTARAQSQEFLRLVDSFSIRLVGS